jgi:hypothetical protein
MESGVMKLIAPFQTVKDVTVIQVIARAAFQDFT